MMVARNRVGTLATALRQSLGRYRRVLADRDATILLAAGFASEIGDWFNTVALISLSFHYGEGALGVGGLLAVRMVPRLLLQGPAGALVDRWPHRRLLLATQLLMAIVASSFAVLTIAPSLWLLYLLVLLLETLGTVARPAFMAALKDAVPSEHRAAANGAFFAAMTVAQLVGPLLGALVLAPLGAAAVFAANGLTFLGVAAAVTRLRGGLSADLGAVAVADSAAEPATPAATPAEIPENVGYGWLLRRRDLGLYALVSLSLALLAHATIALFIIRANTLGLGDGGVGIFYAAVAVGSLVGSVVAGAGLAGNRTALYRVAIAAGGCALALTVFGVAGNLALAVVALAIAGFTIDYHEVTAISYFQDRLPDSIFGRFFSLFLMALSAGGLVGALVSPVLERSVGVSGALAVLAVPGIGFALVLAAVIKRVQPPMPEAEA